MKKGDIIKFGKYPQDEDGRVLPIEWIVLDVTENEAFLISRYALDCKPFEDNHKLMSWWCISELRRWLNNEFIKSAFSDEDTTKILISELKKNGNPKFDIAPGEDTRDRVFCLSLAEAELYFSNDEDRQCVPTAYAVKQGVYVKDKRFFYWWLRSPGILENTAACVDGHGSLNWSGTHIHSSQCAVRPALRIALSSKEEKEQKLVDVVRKTHNLQCGIFGNISDDLGDLPFSELSPMVRMAYAYARRFVAAGLYVQVFFSYDQYMYICTVFMSFQITTAKDANLLPGEDVSFQEEALRQAVELLITYDNRFNISFIKFFSTALSTQGKNFPVLPNGSSYEKAMDVIEKQIAVFTNSTLKGQRLQEKPKSDVIREDKPKDLDIENSCLESDQQGNKSIFIIVVILIIIPIAISLYIQYSTLYSDNKNLTTTNDMLSQEVKSKENVIQRQKMIIVHNLKRINELNKENEEQKNYISELLKQQTKKQKKIDDTSYWTVDYTGNGGFTVYRLSNRSNIKLDLACDGDRGTTDEYGWGTPRSISILLSNKKSIYSNETQLEFVIDGQLYEVPQETRMRSASLMWGNFVDALFKGNNIKVLDNGTTVATFSPTKKSKSLITDAASDCYQRGLW